MSKKKQTKPAPQVYEIWNFEQSYGVQFDSFEEALEKCVDFAIMHKWEDDDFPKNWTMTKHGKLIRTITVDFDGSIRWVCHG
jgi:hypothetical protein